MLFKTASIGAQWANIHPVVRIVLGELDDVLAGWSLSTLTITDAERGLDTQEELYWKSYMAAGFVEAVARQKARAKFSWHLASCAADFRGSKPWGPENEAKVFQWLKQRCPGPQWETLYHEVGAGLHFHVAYRDFSWRRQWERQVTGSV